MHCVPWPRNCSRLKSIGCSSVWLFPSRCREGICQYQPALPSLYTSWTRHFRFQRKRRIGSQQRLGSSDRIEYCLPGSSECNSTQQYAQPSMNMVRGRFWGFDKIRTSWLGDWRWPQSCWGGKGERIGILYALSRNSEGFQKIVDDTCGYETRRDLHVVINCQPMRVGV